MTISKATIDEIKARVRLSDVVRESGIELVAEGRRLLGRCPFHEDDTPSLDVDDSKHGGVYLCRSGNCGAKGDIVSWLREREGLTFGEAVSRLAARAGVAQDDAPSSTKALERARRKVATYEYTDGDGELLYTIERWEPGKNGRSKDFVQRLADGTPKKSTRQVLYRLPRVQRAAKDAETIFVVEGEKCADALERIGLVATTVAGGTGVTKSWPAVIDPLRGARVVVLPDNDPGGQKHAAAVARMLAGLAGEVRVVDLPGLPAAGDVVDWLALGGTRAELVRLAALAPLVERSDKDWRDRLSWAPRADGPRGSIANVLLVLEHDDAMREVLRWDEQAQQAQVLRAPPWSARGPYPRPLADDDVTRCVEWLEAQHKLIAGVDVVGRSILAAAQARPHNALVDYLALLRWDGTPRIDTWLVEYFGAADSELTRAIGAAWLISAVARARRPGCQVDHVLTLEGPQGAGKSSALRALAGAWFSDEMPEMGSKDASLAVGRGWIVELAELDALRKSEVTRVKAFLTRRIDIFRPPYGRHLVEVPRRCVFVASTNDSTYLRDATGNRRFWPVATTKADVGGIERVRDQLWAEAVARFDAGAPWWLTSTELRAAAELEQEARLEVDPWEDVLRSWAEGMTFLTTEGAFRLLEVEKAKRSRSDAMRLASVFRRLGYGERKQHRGSTGREWRFYPSTPLGLSPPRSRSTEVVTEVVTERPNEIGPVTTVTTVTTCSETSIPSTRGEQLSLHSGNDLGIGGDGGDGGDRGEIVDEKRHHLCHHLGENGEGGDTSDSDAEAEYFNSDEDFRW